MTAPTESPSGASETPHTAPEMHATPAAVPERRPGEPEAIFVVGVPRSGTTMMRALLDTSDRISIARENHYMGHVFGRRGARHFFRKAGTDLTNDETIRKIVEMIYSGEYERLAGWRPPSPHWYWLIENIDRDELEQRLLAAERTERGMFRAFISAYAEKKGKPIWGEKTPTHLALPTSCSSGSPTPRSSTCCATRGPSTYRIGTGGRTAIAGRIPGWTRSRSSWRATSSS